jgi:hypothetical protein
MMKPPVGPSSLPHRILLRAAALLVPSPQRTEWLAEWRSELWYVERASNADCGTDSIGNGRTAFCLGAFNDALCVSQLHSREHGSRPFQLRSASQCISLLAAFAVINTVIALLVPGVRNAILAPAFHDPQNIVLLSTNGNGGFGGLRGSPMLISSEQYLFLKKQVESRFDNPAFYFIRPEHVEAPEETTPPLELAQSTENLFEVLGISPPPALLDASKREHAAPLLLSRTAWLKYFGGDPRVIGQVVNVAKQKAMLVGILPDGAWNLPGQTDAWLFEDMQHIGALPPRTYGVFVAQARPSFLSGHPGGSWRFLLTNQLGGYDGVWIQSLTQLVRQHRQQPLFILLSALLLACLNLPAITSLSFGDYPAARDSSWTIRLRRWIFFSTKILFILPIVFFGTFLVAHGTVTTSLDTCLPVQFLLAFASYLLAFRWALADQRQRCPKCLSLLSDPARVGQTAQSFLEWSGTELICAKGHGLLHIPEWPTSWFATQRWLYLDPSWNGLFLVRGCPLS